MYTKECLDPWASEYLEHFYLEACLGASKETSMHFAACAERANLIKQDNQVIKRMEVLW